jgi:hypothetical protein
MKPTLLQIVLGAFFALLLAGIVLPWAQPPVDAGRFEFDIRQPFEGVFRARPIPALWVLRGQDPGRFSNYSVYPLVGPGRQGLSPAAARFDGLGVSLNGKLLYNGTFTAVEADEASIQRLTRVVEFPEPVPPEELGDATLRGEVLDLKTYAGYLEPNHGSWLIAPASNAIQSAVPPLLVIRNRQGDERVAILLNQRGDSLGWEALGQVGTAVEVRGKLQSMGGLLFLEVQPGSFRRLLPWE